MLGDLAEYFLNGGPSAGLSRRGCGHCRPARQGPESAGLNAVSAAENRCAVPVFRIDMHACARRAPSSDFVNPTGGKLATNQAQDGPRLEGACRGHAAIDERLRDPRDRPASGGFEDRGRRSSCSSRLTGWVIALSAPEHRDFACSSDRAPRVRVGRKAESCSAVAAGG